MQGESRTRGVPGEVPAGAGAASNFRTAADLASPMPSSAISRAARSLLPDDAFTQAKIDEWLFWEQYSHEPYVATTRYHMVYLKLHAGRARGLARRALARRRWISWSSNSRGQLFLARRCSDRSPTSHSVAYTRVAHEGGFDGPGGRACEMDRTMRGGAGRIVTARSRMSDHCVVDDPVVIRASGDRACITLIVLFRR